MTGTHTPLAYPNGISCGGCGAPWRVHDEGPALLTALERIADRAQRIADGVIETGAVGAADYDLQVARAAIEKARGA